ncbi:hypothetical protein ACTQ3J_00295 [Oscillospiraceae bacterium LCP25S3_E3]
MTSTTSSNKQCQGFCGMLKWNLRNLTSLSVVYSVILLVVFPFMLAISLLGNGEGAQVLYNVLDNEESITSIFKSNWLIVSIIVNIFVVVISANLFKSFHNRRSTDLVMSLPIKRSTLFLSNFITGLLVIIVPLFVVVLISGLLCGDILVCLTYFIALIPPTLFAYAMYSFLAVCCGTVADTVISYVAINVTYPVLFSAIMNLVYNFSAGTADFCYNGLSNLLTNGDPFKHSLLSPSMGILVCSAETSMSDASMVPYCIYSIIFAAIMFVGAVILFKRRKNENVQMGFIYKLPRIIIIIISSLACGVYIGYTASGALSGDVKSGTVQLLGYVLFSVMGCIVSYLIITSIYNRGGSEILKSIPCLGASVVLSLVIYLLTATGMVSMNMWAPDIKTVKYVSVETSINNNYSGTINEFLGEDVSKDVSEDISNGSDESFYEYYDEYYDGYIDYSTYYYRTVFDKKQHRFMSCYSRLLRLDNKEEIAAVNKLNDELIKEYNEKTPFLRYGNNYSNVTSPDYICVRYRYGDGSVESRYYSSDFFDTDTVIKYLDEICSGNYFKESKFIIQSCGNGTELNMSYNNMQAVDENKKIDVSDTEFANELIAAYNEDFASDQKVFEHFTDLDNADGILFIKPRHLDNITSDEIRRFGGGEMLVIPKDGYEKTKAVLNKYSKEIDGCSEVTAKNYK